MRPILARRLAATAALLALGAAPVVAQPATAAPPDSTAVVIRNVRVFTGRGDGLTAPSQVLVVNDRIARVTTGAVTPPAGARTTVIDGGGRVLTPGFIDVHVHVAIPIPPGKILDNGVGYTYALSLWGAERFLMRGFTTVRDMAGPTMGIKRAIDEGFAVGPRIYPSGAAISQTSGHGDFRAVLDAHKHFGGHSHPTELLGWSTLADGPSEVLAAVREQLRQGATQIKVMAGGGISSTYDPLDVAEYTTDELKAAVAAASDWGTYVSTHVYNPLGIRRAVEAGVRSIEHGNLIDEPTMQLLAERGTFLSSQAIAFENVQSFLTADQRAKKLQAREGTAVMFTLAKKHGVKTPFGTDLQGDLKAQELENREFALRARWFTPAEVLRQATSVAAELLALSGNRNPYPGKLGVVEEGAWADLLLIDGNPLENIRLLEEPDRNLLVIMKGGRIHKNTLPRTAGVAATAARGAR